MTLQFVLQFQIINSATSQRMLTCSRELSGQKKSENFMIDLAITNNKTRALIILLHGTFFTGVYIPEAQLYQFSVPALTKILHGRILAHRPIGLLRPARKFPILDVKSFP